jgi:hypothetical protein
MDAVCSSTPFAFSPWDLLPSVHLKDQAQQVCGPGASPVYMDALSLTRTPHEIYIPTALLAIALLMSPLPQQ